jgi:hypothetical protein
MVPAALAFDSTPVSSAGVNRPWKTGSNFTFMLLPLDHRLPDAVLKSVKHPPGHINLGIRDLRDELLEIMKQNGFLCHFIATDGDNGVKGSHKAAFEKYAGLGETDIRAILAALIQGKFCESSHESIPWSGGGLTTR